MWSPNLRFRKRVGHRRQIRPDRHLLSQTRQGAHRRECRPTHRTHPEDPHQVVLAVFFRGTSEQDQNDVTQDQFAHNSMYF